MSDLGLAAVVFTDVVGSTAQRAELGEEVAEELRRTHDRLVAEAVVAHGGRVVKSTGDGVMAAFPGAAEAVASAIGIQQEVDRHNQRADAIAPLSLRVGVSLGDVTFESDDMFGTPVIEAARLCAKAEGGQILATDVVPPLARSHVGEVFEPAGLMELKGLPAPTAVTEVRWEPVAEPGFPVPAALGVGGRFAFVGREEELGLLHEAWREALDGARRAVFVAGEPGVGKTRLLAEFAGQAALQGAAVLYGRADADLGVPHQPFVQALSGYVRTCPPSELAAQCGPLSGELLRLVPELADAVPDLAEPSAGDPEVLRYRMFEAVAELLTNASSSWPVVLILDDLHWAGAPTTTLLRHLLTVDPAMRLLIVGAYRHTDVDSDHPLTKLLGDLPRMAGAEQLALGGLDGSDVSAMAAEAAGTAEPDLGEGVVDSVISATGGNALFVAELLRTLSEAGRLDSTGSTGDAGDLVPAGVAALVTARVAGLEHSDQEILQAAAVVGQRFDLQLLIEMVGDDQTALSALAAAESAGLVDIGDDPRQRTFHHALVRDAIYASMPPTRLLAQHAAVCEAIESIEESDSFADELAHHSALAVPIVPTERAIRYLRRAGDRAAKGLAFEEAATRYRSALTLLDDNLKNPGVERLRCELEVALGTALRGTSYPEARQVLLRAAEHARSIEAPDLLVEAALVLGRPGRGLMWGDDELLRLITEALDSLPPGDSAERALLLTAHAQVLNFLKEEHGLDYLRDEPLPDSSEALPIARRLKDRTVLAKVLIQHWFSLQDPDQLEERAQLAAELTQVAAQLDDPEIGFWAAHQRYTAAMELGDANTAEAAIDDCDRFTKKLSTPELVWQALTARTQLALHRGDLKLAEELADEAVSQGAGRLDDDGMLAYSTHLFQLRREQGRLEELAIFFPDTGPPPDPKATGPQLEGPEGEGSRSRGDDLAPEDGGPTPILSALVLGVMVMLETGKKDRARTIFERFAAHDFADFARDYMWLTIMHGLATLAHDLGDRERSAFLYGELVPYAKRNAFITSGISDGPVDRILALLAHTTGDLETADRHFADAEQLCQQMQMPTYLARTRLQWALMLHQRDQPGDPDRARLLATQALTAAGQLGMGQVTDQARALLHDLPGS